ncbi:unnamed protein product [Rhizophagus irregularis]|nr:unnamed protein product [Rhizophagus irregularis]
MKATNNITLKAFWTDSELGLINAAAHIFPTIPHFYCLFHIWQNITKHLKTKLEIQSIQSVESFNAIIKKALINSASSLCDIEKVIDKRYEAEFQYCKLANLKAYQTTVGLPHLSSQFFSNIDAVLNQFLTPLVLSWQIFKSLNHLLTKNLVDAETANDNFIKDIIDEPQITLASLLNGIETSNIIEMWRIRCIGGLSRKNNLVILLDDGTHLCTCLETITKAIETSTDITSFQITCIFQSLHHIQGLDRSEVVHQNTHQRNKFRIAFSTVNTAINVALETNSDDDDIKENHDIIGINESSQEDGSIIPLQKDLIKQITDLYVTKIRGAPSKKRLKSAIKVSKKRILMQEISDKSNTQPVK